MIPIYQAKAVKKKDQLLKDLELRNTVARLEYIVVHNDPLYQEASQLVKQSNVMFLNIKEMEEQDPEHCYLVCVDGFEEIFRIGHEEDAIHLLCKDFFAYTCCKFV